MTRCENSEKEALQSTIDFLEDSYEIYELNEILMGNIKWIPPLGGRGVDIWDA